MLPSELVHQANRVLLHDRLAALLSTRPERGCLLLLDLDDFTIVDMYGHAHAHALLVGTAPVAPEVEIGTSIGLVMIDFDRRDVDELLRGADLALFATKSEEDSDRCPPTSCRRPRASNRRRLGHAEEGVAAHRRTVAPVSHS